MYIRGPVHEYRRVEGENALEPKYVAREVGITGLYVLFSVVIARDALVTHLIVLATSTTVK